MRILIALIMFCSMDVFGQYRVPTYYIDSTKPKATRIDTTYGSIVTLDGYDVFAIPGFRVDSVDVWEVQIDCPENKMGCLVFHYGDRDFVRASTYYASKRCGVQIVLEKHIIKFVE